MLLDRGSRAISERGEPANDDVGDYAEEEEQMFRDI